MKNFEYYNPVRIIFGAGEVKKIGTCALSLGQKVCLVSYKNLGFLSPLLEKVEKLLIEAGLKVYTFYEIEENPEIKAITKGVELCKKQNVDLVIGVGGGSAMDAAKSIAAGVYYEGDLWNMVNSRHSVNVAIPPVKSLPTLMLPTLPATGSEMNLCAVVSNRELKEKSYIWSECLYPKISIIDPELTVTLPAYQTACAAADTISHVLEIYLNGEEDSDLQHYFQEGVMKTVIDNIDKVLKNPKDISARSHLQWAATCGINGWASPGDAWTPMHQIGHVLTSQYGVAHGASLSIIMPAWMKVMYPRRIQQYCRFARNVMGVSDEGLSDKELAEKGIESFKNFLKRIGVPLTLTAMNIPESGIPLIVENVVKVSFGADGCLACQPRPVTQEDITEVLHQAL